MTYVNVKGKWNYICLIIDLYNCEIIAYAAVAEATYKIIKTEFAFNTIFESFEEL